MNIVGVGNIKCPKCGGNVFDSDYTKDKLYICKSKFFNDKLGDYITCGHIQAFCKKCNKIYDESGFGKHGDVWECKECGSVCWPLTEKKRSIENARSQLNKMNSELDNFLKNFNF